jgi:hypothetical protein
MTINLAEPVPLFIDSWESRMRAACLAYNRACAQIEARYQARPMQNPSKREMKALSDARWQIRLLTREVGE